MPRDPMTPSARWEARELAKAIVADKFDVRGVDLEDIIDIAAELTRLDNEREVWDCADCGRSWRGPARPALAGGHVCKPTVDL